MNSKSRFWISVACLCERKKKLTQNFRGKGFSVWHQTRGKGQFLAIRQSKSPIFYYNFSCLSAADMTDTRAMENLHLQDNMQKVCVTSLTANLSWGVTSWPREPHCSLCISLSVFSHSPEDSQTAALACVRVSQCASVPVCVFVCSACAHKALLMGHPLRKPRDNATTQCSYNYKDCWGATLVWWSLWCCCWANEETPSKQKTLERSRWLWQDLEHKNKMHGVITHKLLRNDWLS